MLWMTEQGYESQSCVHALEILCFLAYFYSMQVRQTSVHSEMYQRTLTFSAEKVLFCDWAEYKTNS